MSKQLEQKYQDFILSKPSTMTVDDFKMEQVLQRKQEQMDFNFKKNIFLLNKQEILKDYVRIGLSKSNFYRKKSR